MEVVQWNRKLNKIYLNIFTIKKSSNQNNNNLNLIIRFMIGLDITILLQLEIAFYTH